MRSYRTFFGLRLSVVLIATYGCAQIAFGQQYTRITRSPYKSDPPGTYIETRADGSQHFYKGGVKYKTRSRSGQTRSVPPPSRYEVKPDGSLWKREYRGFNQFGNKVWNRQKVTDMLPSEYVTKDSHGSIVRYDVDRYLKTTQSGTHSTNSTIFLHATESLTVFSTYPPSDPNASSGHIVFHLNGWPHCRYSVWRGTVDAVAALKLSHKGGARYDLGPLSRDRAEDRYFAMELPAGPQQVVLEISLHDDSFWDPDIPPGADTYKRPGNSPLTFRINRSAQYERQHQFYSFAMNACEGLRTYFIIKGPESIRLEMDVYVPKGGAKVIELSMEDIVSRTDVHTYAAKKLEELYGGNWSDDFNTFEAWKESGTRFEYKKNRVRRDLTEYRFQVPKWEINKRLRAPSFDVLQELLYDDKKTMIVLGEVAPRD